MNRAIKFRGKRVDNGEWVTGSYLYDHDQDCHRIVESFFDVNEPKLEFQFGVDAHEVIPETVGQYVGLKDKNKKLVFTGDCLGGSYEGLHVDYCEKCKQFQLVITDMNVCLACQGEFFWHDFIDDRGIVVIGNIWDNADKLEGQV